MFILSLDQTDQQSCETRALCPRGSAADSMMGQCRCSEQQSGGQEAVAALRSRRSRLSCRPCVGFTCVSRRRFQQRLMKRMAGLEAKGLSSSASPLVGHGIPHITADAPDPPPRSLARESSSTLSSRRLQPVCSGPLRVPRIRTAYERTDWVGREDPSAPGLWTACARAEPWVRGCVG